MYRERGRGKMVKESARKCSHCGNNGHNSRTCNGKGSVKLFGVFILTNKKQELIRKSKSMGDLIACNGEHSNLDEGYLSDGLIDSRRDKEAHERKKGIPWTEDEHRFFLAGLDKLGKGDWRGISKTFVPSRTPTQVASHAQKYFIRLGSSDKKKRRSSLFDLSFKEPEIHRSPLQAPLEKNGEISQQANNPPAAVNLNNFCHTQGQASTSVASPLDAPPVFPLASTCGVPDLYMPMMGFAGNGQATSGAKGIPTISFVPVMNFLNRGYFYMPKGYGNSATCAPFLSHP